MNIYQIFVVCIRMIVFHCEKSERNINIYYYKFLNEKYLFSKFLTFRVGYSIFSRKNDSNVLRSLYSQLCIVLDCLFHGVSLLDLGIK